MDERLYLPSASSMRRYIECPGSFLTSNGLPEESSPDADRGTKIHAFLAGEKVELNDEEADMAVSCETLAAEILREWAPDGWMPSEGEVMKEQRLWLAIGEQKLFSGKADVIWKDGTRFLVVDYKTGRAETEAADVNAQLASLAALIAANYPASEVMVAIVAPLQRPSVTKAVWADDALDAVLKLTERTAYLVTQPGQPLKAGDWCQYCRANGICAATKREIETLAVTTVSERDGVVVTPEEMGVLLQRVRVVERACRSIRAKAQRMLEDGLEVPGVCLKPGAVRQKITDLRTVFQRCVDRGVMPAEFVAATTITKSNLKACLKSATGAKGKALDEELSRVLEGAVEEKRNKPQISFVGETEEEAGNE